MLNLNFFKLQNKFVICLRIWTLFLLFRQFEVWKINCTTYLIRSWAPFVPSPKVSNFSCEIAFKFSQNKLLSHFAGWDLPFKDIFDRDNVQNDVGIFLPGRGTRLSTAAGLFKFTALRCQWDHLINFKRIFLWCIGSMEGFNYCWFKACKERDNISRCICN